MPIDKKKRTPEHNSWRGMKHRCYNKNSKDYKYWGGKGVVVCDRWLEPNGKGFINFLNDMGMKPEPKHQYSIDRKDNDGNYCPENCYWATRAEQYKNQRHGIIKLVSIELAEQIDKLHNTGISYRNIATILNVGASTVYECAKLLKTNN